MSNRARWLCIPVLALLSGCYIIRQAVGQIDILLNREDIEAVLASEDLSPGQKAKLRLILDVKEFGEVEVGLTPTDNYTTYYKVHEGHVSYVVSACPRDSFRRHMWSFPIVGDLPYKGFFDLDDAKAEARAMKEEGYDVSVRPVAAYSTLGWFSDPVFSTMLSMPEEDLVDLILHELSHSTLFVSGRADYNENLASFVGTTAGLQYLHRRHGIRSPFYRRAVEKSADRRTYAEFIEGLFARLNGLYESEIPTEEKLRKREEIFLRARREFRSFRSRFNTGRYAYFESLEMNNAEILAERLYVNDGPFRATYDEAGGDWKSFWGRLRRSEGAGD